jgi:hypothetical protein
MSGGEIVCSTGEVLTLVEACRMLHAANVKYIEALATEEIERRPFYRRASQQLQQAVSAAAMWRASA